MWPVEASLCFLRGHHYREIIMVAENLEVYSYLFDMKWHVIAKHSNIIVVKKLLVDEKNNSLCEVCLQGVLCKAFNRKKLLGETFCFLENVSNQYLNVVLGVIFFTFFFYELLIDWPTTKFPVIRLVNFV